MKKLKIYFGAILLMVSASCSRELIGGDGLGSRPDGSAGLDDAVGLNASQVEFRFFAAEVATTKSSYEAMDSRISDLCIFIYNEGRLCEGASLYWNEDGLMDAAASGRCVLTLPNPKLSYNLYFLANLGDLRAEVAENCREESSLTNRIFRLQDYSSFEEKGLPMAQSLQSWRKGDCSDISLVRLVSRIDVRFVNAPGMDVEVKSMALRQGARSLKPFGEGGFGAQSSADVLEICDYLTPDDIDAATRHGATASLYCCENMMGVLLPDNTSPEAKSLDSLPENLRPCVTYFEICARVRVGNAQWEDVFYRFCLGLDAVSDFNIPRNHILGYTVDFASTPHDTGWTVVPDEPIYDGNVRVVTTIAPFYPGWDSYTFLDASVENPVRVSLPWSSVVIDGETYPDRNDISALEEYYIVMGKTLYVYLGSRYTLTAQQNGCSAVSYTRPAKERLVFRLVEENAKSDYVLVDYLLGGEDYQLRIMPYSDLQRRIVPWSDVMFPEEVCRHFGAAKISNFWNGDCDFGIYKSSSPGSGDSGQQVPYEDLYYSFGLGPGLGMVSISAPNEDVYLSYYIMFNLMNVNESYHDISVFNESNLPGQNLEGTLQMNNASADLYLKGPSQEHIAFPAAVSNHYGLCQSGIVGFSPYGTLSAFVDSDARGCTLRLGPYTSGHSSLDFFFWDYDQAPSPKYHQNLDIWLDVTYVPDFGVLYNPGLYATSSFSGASVTRSGRLTTVASHVWGYRLLPARDDSRCRTRELNEYGNEGILWAIGNGAPPVRSASIDVNTPPSSANVALYNTGDIFYNDSVPGEGNGPDGEGTIFFCDPAQPGHYTWTLGYESAQSPTNPYWQYPFRTMSSVPKTSLDNAARSQLWDCSHYAPVFWYGGSRTADVLHRELSGGLLVNYHLRYDTCLELLSGDWTNF